MAIFGPKPWVNSVGKMSIFRLFLTCCFYSLERLFLFLEYHKRHFPGLYCLKKKLEKWPFFDQNQGLTPQEKCQFLEFLDFFFFIAQKGVFSFQNIIKDIFLAYIALKKKEEKIAIFGPQPWVNPFGKMSIFRIFSTCCFYSL